MPATSVTMARAAVAPCAQSETEQKSVATLALLDRDIGSWERTQGRGHKMRPYGSFREGEHEYVV
jgi:hypothetical protein